MSSEERERNSGAQELTALSVEYLLLSDGAQVVSGKLYLLGGGWDRLQFPEYPQDLFVGIALGVRVPWTETNRPHTFIVRVQPADGGGELIKVEGQFEVGRPPGLPQGTSQLFQVAFQGPLRVPNPGAYEVRASVDGDRALRSVPYFAVKMG